MSEKRFEYDVGDKGPLIYDNNGVDDYYFINDPEEMEKFINLINTTEDEWREKYNHIQGEYIKILHENTEKDLKISQLKKELTLMKDKAYHYGDLALCEISSTFDEDLEGLRQEIYGEEAEQIKQKEIQRDKEHAEQIKEWQKKGCPLP